MEIMAMDVATRENKRCKQVEELLPGISDHIVLDKIVPKLQWKDFYVLSSVSSAWYDAIRSRRVFDLRVVSHSSETLVLVSYTESTIALYSMRENSWHKLPPIPDISGGQHKLPGRGRCILMDGKIYVLGRGMDPEVTNKMFVFDLAGQGHWEQRASTNQQRLCFGSAVIDGKIYVFGGIGPGNHCKHCVSGANNRQGKPISASRPMSCSEVYEPKEDTWSPISPLTTCQFQQDVLPIGEELFMYKGSTNNSVLVSALEAYHPVTDEWRVVHRSWNRPDHGSLFTAQGNLFSVQPDDTHGNLSLRPLAIHKYDLHGNSWMYVHSFLFAALIPDGYHRRGMEWRNCLGALPDAILAWDDELIAVVRCERRGEGTEGLCLFQSTGFGGENREISWKLRAISFQQELSRRQARIIEYLVHKL